MRNEQKLNQFRLSGGVGGLRQFVALCGPFSPSSAGESVCDVCVNVCAVFIKANMFTHFANSFINNNQGGQKVGPNALQEC